MLPKWPASVSPNLDFRQGKAEAIGYKTSRGTIDLQMFGVRDYRSKYSTDHELHSEKARLRPSGKLRHSKAAV